jgi:hypothetical protein
LPLSRASKTLLYSSEAAEIFALSVRLYKCEIQLFILWYFVRILYQLVAFLTAFSPIPLLSQFIHVSS